MPLAPFDALAIAVAAFFVGFFKATLGLAIGLLLVPVMVFVWPTRFVFGIIAVQMWLSDYLALKYFWKRWDGRLVKLVLPGFFFGIILGAYLLVQLPDFWIRKGLGALCLVFAGLQAVREFGRELAPPRLNSWMGVGIGLAGGTMSTLFHSGGLILNLYLLSQGVTKVPLVATVIAVWILMNPVKLTSYWVGGIVNLQMFLACLLAAPLTFAGVWAGKRALEWAPQKAYNLGVLVLAAAAAVKLLAE
ncbi:MAG: sulfite exporter TauE/SafE family protein [Candidatus Tectomicrobia bacterium]|uniref:Probable membrane transporter protein n=1 Tax=Tectimicrobiota bacterium TaxID=2528274 RepID=A0A932HZT1_UNCTE|nr:sulfite exporter TauE/SafE family protein [Candidatus Tectomicrobia bacterium]